jgi:hypothetical protein
MIREGIQWDDGAREKPFPQFRSFNERSALTVPPRHHDLSRPAGRYVVDAGAHDVKGTCICLVVPGETGCGGGVAQCCQTLT